jgi:hypothetical protein
MKSERRTLGDPVYSILQQLFEDADAYVEQAALRTELEDLDDEQLLASALRARRALRGLGYELGPKPAPPTFRTVRRSSRPDRQGRWKLRGRRCPKSARACREMLINYRDLIRRFVIGEISADEFETDYLARLKDDPNQVIGEEFDILDELFADVDDYVSGPTLRESTGGISGEELRARARDAYTRLFDAHE